VPYQILLIPEFFLEGGGGLYEKGSKGKKEKGTFTRYVDFFKISQERTGFDHH
jgi:hypothetical protein